MSNTSMVEISRQQLYDEIWKISVAGVAKKYNLHYAKLLESLKAYDIPYPSSGYWARAACGKDVSAERMPLTQNDLENVYLYPADYSFSQRKKQENSVVFDVPAAVLPFLEEEERGRVINELKKIQVKPNAKIHPVLAAYKKSIEEWKQRQKNDAYIKRGRYDYYRGQKIEPPVFVSEVSGAGLKRVIAILNTLYKIIERLGGDVRPDLSMKIRKDVVSVSFSEGQDKKLHELTKQEARMMLEYKEKVKSQEYASKPQVKKYDYYYNGKLRIKFSNGKYIRDNEQEKIEDRIDEIILELYGISEECRIEREKREEEHRKYLEEQHRKKEFAERSEIEKEKTQALINEAKDYQIACEIRNYVSALKESRHSDEIETEWFQWAEKKADWIDPTISLEDPWLGRRNHGADNVFFRQLP